MRAATRGDDGAPRRPPLVPASIADQIAPGVRQPVQIGRTRAAVDPCAIVKTSTVRPVTRSSVWRPRIDHFALHILQDAWPDRFRLTDDDHVNVLCGLLRHEGGVRSAHHHRVAAGTKLLRQRICVRRARRRRGQADQVVRLGCIHRMGDFIGMRHHPGSGVNAASSGMVSCGKRIHSRARACRVSGSSAVTRCNRMATSGPQLFGTPIGALGMLESRDPKEGLPMMRFNRLKPGMLSVLLLSPWRLLSARARWRKVRRRPAL